MQNLAKNNRFLTDLSQENLPDDFEQQLARTGFAAARKSRRRRMAIRQGLILMTLSLLLIPKISFHQKSSSQVRVVAPLPERSYVVIKTEPFNHVLRSQTLETSQLLSSTRNDIAIFETDLTEKTYSDISDKQLLSLLGGQKVVLVRPSSHSAELLFLE